MKRNLLIFEGVSGSGKSTLENMYRSENKYNDFTIHRFTGSKWVYSKLYNRPINESELRWNEIRLAEDFPVYLIVLVCPENEAINRKYSLGDDNVEENITKANDLFIEYYNHFTMFKRKLILNTSLLSIFSSIDQIREFVHDNKNS